MSKSLMDFKEFVNVFSKGDATDAYKFLGCHKESNGYVFRVWAPGAIGVSLCGDFNRWNKDACPMTPVLGGIWEACVCGAKIFDNYKYCIQKPDGTFVYMVDGIYNEEAEPGTDFRAVVDKYISVGIINNLR